MTDTPTAHNSKEFFIDGKMFLVRPLNPADSFADETCSQLAEANNYAVFGRTAECTGRLVEYLHNSDKGYVFVATSEESDPNNHEPAGLAMYVKDTTSGSHEMTILITQEYVNSRLVFELADSLIKDAADHRVAVLYAVGRSDNRPLNSLATKLGMSPRLEPGGGRQVKYSLQVDKHPGIVRL